MESNGHNSARSSRIPYELNVLKIHLNDTLRRVNEKGKRNKLYQMWQYSRKRQIFLEHDGDSFTVTLHFVPQHALVHTGDSCVTM